MIPLNAKVNSLNRKLKSTDIEAQLSTLKIHTPHQIAAIQSLASRIKNTELEGLPFTIAMMKAKLLSDKEIAEELNLPVKTIRKQSQVDGFTTLLNQMMPAIWSDLILAAQATLLFHISVENNLEAAKWLLESLGQVASSKPLTNHNHQTLVLQGSTGMPGALGGSLNSSPLLTGESHQSVTVENLAEAMFKRLTDNQKSPTVPPIEISRE